MGGTVDISHQQYVIDMIGPQVMIWHDVISSYDMSLYDGPIIMSLNKFGELYRNPLDHGSLFKKDLQQMVKLVVWILGIP